MPRPSVSAPSALRSRYEQRSTRLTALRSVRGSLVSLAGLVGRPVRNQAGSEVGTVADVVARWDTGGYPPLTGLVARVGRRRLWVPIARVSSIGHGEVLLGSPTIDVREFARRPGEIELSHDVVDHQLIDTDGARVVRASDLYLARVAGVWSLVGVDVGVASLLRRLGPARFRVRPTPVRVVDWAGIHSFGGDGRPGSPLRTAGAGLRALRPAELADVLEDLGRVGRMALLTELPPEQAADALEEMEPGELAQLLRESDPVEAGELLGMMEPDEAADALRDLDDDEVDELLAAMPGRSDEAVRPLLDYGEDTAGGIMTTRLWTAGPTDTLAAVRDRVRADHDEEAALSGVVVLDDAGRLVDDLTPTELWLADPSCRVDELIGPPWPVTVGPADDVEVVAERLTRSRRPSVLVTDGDGRPLGRIVADDVVDALTDARGRVRFPRRLA